MKYEMKEGSFTLFVNDRKRGEADADWTGSIKLADGIEYWFNAYEKQAKTGKKYLAGKIGKPKQAGFTPRGNDEMPRSDSDIPF
jgi:hypothetical protein